MKWIKIKYKITSVNNKVIKKLNYQYNFQKEVFSFSPFDINIISRRKEEKERKNCISWVHPWLFSIWRSSNSGRFFNRRVQVVIYKVGMRLGRPLTAIHYSLPPLPVIIFPYSQPTSTLLPHIPPHHLALCIPGLSIQPTILANIITPWDYEFCIRLSLLPRHPFFDVLHNPSLEWRWFTTPSRVYYRIARSKL